MKTRQDKRDLGYAGAYVLSGGLLLGSMAFAGAAAWSEMQESPFVSWVASTLEISRNQPSTRMTLLIDNAREIRAALAKPIPRPEPLPLITAKLAYGHLKPGASGATAIAQQGKAGMNAMAMDVSSSNFRASSAVIPEMHKVY